jgi:hypothetical protein
VLLPFPEQVGRDSNVVGIHHQCVLVIIIVHVPAFLVAAAAAAAVVVVVVVVVVVWPIFNGSTIIAIVVIETRIGSLHMYFMVLFLFMHCEPR